MTLFDEAADLEGGAREDYFRKLAEDEPELARELRALFAYEPTTTQGARTGDGIRVMGGPRHGAPPDTDGRFEIVRMLGEGGMGTVYLAQQKQPWRRVALKVLKGELASERVRRRFAAEGDILARLSHPGIASVYEAVDSGAEPYLVMEYVDGIPLGEWKAKTKPDLRTKVQLLIKIAEAIDHAHRSGVVHRDLKPANILVTADGNPKVLDFGIARVMDPDRVSDSSITQAGEIIGTPAYMSPEQASLDPSRIDHRTDVYVLGVVSYELLTDYMPYPIDTDLMLNLTRIRALAPTRAGKLAPSLRGDLEVILDKALQKTPEARYQSAAAFAEDLGRWLRGETILARPPSVLYQLGKFARRNRLLVLAFSALFVALVVGAVATTMLWLEGRRTQRELERRVDDLVLLQARETLATDATRAVEMMRALGPSADWAKAYTIGWDARGRGVSEDILKGHEADVEWHDIAPDGTIASASFDGTVRVWHDGVGTVMRGHVGGVNRVAWSSRGVLASAGRDGTVRVWPGGEVVHTHEDECEEIAWAPDGSAIASVGGDGVLALTTMSPRSTRQLMRSDKALSAVLWRGDVLVAGGKGATLVRIDLPTGRPFDAAVVQRLEGHKAEVDILGVFTDGGPLLASGASDGELRIWDGDAVRSFPSPEGSPLKGVEFLSRNQVVTVDRAGTLRIWDLLRGTAASFAGGGVYRDLTVSPDRAWLATASDDRTTVLWDVQTLESIVLRGHRDAVLHVEIAGGHLVSGGKEGDLRVWPLPNQRTRWPLEAVPRALAVAGSEFVSVDEGGALSRGSLGSGEMLEIDEGIDGHLVHWAHDGSRFLTSLRQGVVQVRMADGRKLSQLELPGRPIMGAFSADDKRMAVVTNDGSLALVVEGQVAIHALPCGRANAVAFIGAAVAIGCRDGAVLRFDGAAFTEVARLPGEVDHVVAEGVWLGAAGGHEARSWRVGETWEAVGGTHHAGPIHALAVLDGRLVTGARDGVIKVSRGGVEQTLTGHTAGVTSLVLHGDTLISGGRDRTVRIWDLTTGAAVVIDLFEGPITALALASSVAGGAIDRVMVMADEKAITAWPLRLEQSEGAVRAFLDGLVHPAPSLEPGRAAN